MWFRYFFLPRAVSRYWLSFLIFLIWRRYQQHTSIQKHIFELTSIKILIQKLFSLIKAEISPCVVLLNSFSKISRNIPEISRKSILVLPFFNKADTWKSKRVFHHKCFLVTFPKFFCNFSTERIRVSNEKVNQKRSFF